MRHVSCDLCGKDLIAEEEPRYILRMESEFVDAAPFELAEGDLEDQTEDDSVEAMVELLDGKHEGVEGRQAKAIAREYDFCGTCYRRFQADPLGLERARNMHFSAN